MSGRSAKKVVSLSSELHLVARALDGVRLLSEQWKELHLNEEDLPRVAHALHATSVLVRERLRLLDSVVRDTVDARLLFTEENEALGAPADDGDIVLRSWSVRKEAKKLRKAAERAERRLLAVRGRRRMKTEDVRR